MPRTIILESIDTLLLLQFNSQSSIILQLPQHSTENLLEKSPTPNFITLHKFWKLSMSYPVLYTSLSPSWNSLVILWNSYSQKMAPPYLHTYCHSHLASCKYSISRLTSQIYSSQNHVSYHFAMAILSMSHLCFKSFNCTHQQSHPYWLSPIFTPPFTPGF